MKQRLDSSSLPDFNARLALARSDPTALETLRERLTDDVIRRAITPAVRVRLQGLKFRIEMERRRARDPLDACERISALMHRSFADLRRALHAPDALLARRRGRSSAKVFSFPGAPVDPL